MFYFACALLVLQVYNLVVLLYGRAQARALPADANIRGDWPSVSIIIPARDEEAEIEQALRSVLALDYPNVEVIVVNDRSTDLTGEVLSRVQVSHPQLRVETIAELPAGWLGKNHALMRGVSIATGELLLFTDADIVFTPDALKRTVALMVNDGIDHLTVSPVIRSDSFWINLLSAMFIRNFTLFVKPWRARDPKSENHIGLGAFNLVRQTAYTAAGGHERIRLRPDDDMKLGKILKLGGFRQEIVFGPDALSLQWYSSVRAMTVGLEKNILAGVDYRAWFLAFGLAALLVSDLGPLALIGWTDLATTIVAVAAAVVSMWTLALFLPFTSQSRFMAVLTPLLTAIIVWIFARSAFLTLKRGGIAWRGCFYPLAELRRNEI